MRSTILTIFALIFLVAAFKVHAEELDTLEQFQKALSISDDVKRYDRLVELYLGATKYHKYLISEALIVTAWDVGNFTGVQKYTDKLSLIINDFKEDRWFGNTWHILHTYKGVIAYRGGDISKAREYLYMSVGYENMPEIKAFSPNTTLASMFLKDSEFDVVKVYLESLRSRWKSRPAVLNDWIRVVQSHKVPSEFCY